MVAESEFDQFKIQASQLMFRLRNDLHAWNIGGVRIDFTDWVERAETDYEVFDAKLITFINECQSNNVNSFDAEELQMDTRIYFNDTIIPMIEDLEVNLIVYKARIEMAQKTNDIKNYISEFQNRFTIDILMWNLENNSLTIEWSQKVQKNFDDFDSILSDIITEAVVRQFDSDELENLRTNFRSHFDKEVKPQLEYFERCME